MTKFLLMLALSLFMVSCVPTRGEIGKKSYDEVNSYWKEGELRLTLINNTKLDQKITIESLGFNESILVLSGKRKKVDLKWGKYRFSSSNGITGDTCLLYGKQKMKLRLSEFKIE